MMECSVKNKVTGKYDKLTAFKEFHFDNGTKIGIFQGRLGGNPDLDIIIKYKELGKGKRVRTPKHIHWAIDLLIKKTCNPTLTKEFIKYLVNMWDKVQPFTCKEEQQKCELKFTNTKELEKFKELNQYGEYKVEFIGHIIELMMIEEKTGSRNAFLFKKVLDSLYNDAEIFQIVSSATFRGRLS